MHWLMAVLLLMLPQALLAAQAHVAVAANFSAPMKAIAADFERQTGHVLKLSFGATGQFEAQIRNGAPFAVLLAADEETPRRLEAEGHAVKGSRFTYATGRLVLWSKQPALVDQQGAVLRQGKFQRIAVANPKLSPYGAAAMATLVNMGLIPGLNSKMVEGANITKAFQFVDSGNAELGFVAWSQVVEGGSIKVGSGWLVPASMHAPIRQAATLLVPGVDNPAARALLQYLQGDKAKAVIRTAGYEL